MLTAAAAAVLVLAGCASTAPSGRDAPTGGVDARVTRDGDLWAVNYVLDRDAPAWAFFQSALLRESRQPWRPDWWSVETPGVILDRQGDYDVLRSADGGPVPRRIRIIMRPRPGDLEAEYDPALMFSDGAVALYSGQFDLIPLPSADAARTLPTDLNGVDVPGGPARVAWRDAAGPVLFKGRRLAEARAADAKTYVLFGQAPVSEGDGVTTVIDPGLPAWIGDELRRFTPQVMTYYTRRLGEGGGAPTVMVSWTGPTSGVTSMGGSVLPGLVTMSFEGVGVVAANPAILARSRWFIGHESAHFWLGQAVRYEFARDAWITEGGADLMAVRALQAVDDAYDARTELQGEVDDCIDLARGKAVAEAATRGEHRAYYACGAVFALVAEGALRKRDPGADVFDFLKPLIDANRKDEVLTRTEWLAALTQVSGDPGLARDIDRMLDQGVADPAAEVARLFDRSGVAYVLEGGRVVLR